MLSWCLRYLLPVTTRFSTSKSPFRALLALATAATLIAAYGTSSASAQAQKGGATDVKASAARVTASAASAATLTTTKVAGYGTVLANSKHKPVYLFSADPKNGSKCTGSCAKQWQPVTVTGKPKAGAGVKGSMISTFKRKGGGGTQVSYDGHALYTYPSPLPGSGAGQASNGGVWYLVGANGQPIKKTTGGGY